MNLNSVDLNLLVVFEALLDERNVTRAAERVARAQPSVSNALNRLRYLFKDELFIRTPNGMIPTSKALELEQPIREALNGVRIALATHDEFDPQQCEGTIHLATSDTVELVLVPTLLKRLQESAPRVNLRFHPLDKDHIHGQIDAGDIDVALGVFDPIPKRFESAHLYDDHFVCIARKQHPDIDERLTLNTFCNTPHIFTSLRDDTQRLVKAELKKRHKPAPRTAVTVAHFLVVPHLIAQSDFIAIVSQRLASQIANQANCRIYTPPIKFAPWSIHSLRSKTLKQTPVQQWFHQFLLQTAYSI